MPDQEEPKPDPKPIEYGEESVVKRRKKLLNDEKTKDFMQGFGS